MLEKCARNPAFDDQLAGYVFLPLSHTLKVCQKKPGRIAESATKCLKVLLAYGWKGSFEVQLSHQLLILLTLFAGGGPPSITVSEELKFEALKALMLLFEDVRLSPRAAASLTDMAIIPAVGQCVSTILDCIKEGETPEIQLEALKALGSLWKCMRTQQQALSTFLPGSVSTLTHCLTPTTQNSRTGKVLVLGLKTLSQVLTSVIGDMRVMNLKDDTSNVEKPLKNQPTLTKSWLKASASQINLALGNIIKLRSHSNADVRQALEELCLTLLDECQYSLQVSVALLVETAMIAASSLGDHTPSTTLKDLAAIHPPISNLIKTTTYNWATSLPRVMQGSDESAKAAALQHIARAPELLGDLEYGSDVLESALVGCLKDSVMSAIESGQAKAGIEEASASSNDDLSSCLTVASDSVAAKEYRSLVLAHESQRTTRSQFTNLLSHVGSQEIQLQMASELLEQVPHATGDSLLSSIWLSFQLLKSASIKSKDLDSLFTSDVTASDKQEAVMDEIYNYSLSTISESDTTDTDWRVLAVALEVVAFSADQQQEAFRPSLVDALYPVVQLLGSGNQNLREHAITTLNIVSGATGYNTTSEMIVDNVDYLVNAVSLKLNTFNISPQAPRVLVMMIKLSGPSLLPYMDDVVGSIFAALDNFHGYTALVDGLFSVLREIVDESTKSGQLRITPGKEIFHLKQKPQLSTLNDLTELLAGLQKMKAAPSDDTEHEKFPRKPWKTAKELLDEADAKRASEEGKEKDLAEDVPRDNNEVAKIPPTKVYSMVESITRLSQYYLTSPSSHLRLRLLDLISTASRALNNNEDQFLPLLNDVWPVVIKRLYDSEPYVVIGAAKTIGALCEAAGDFMVTRIRSEWADMIRLIRSSKLRAKTERSGKHGRGVYALSWQVWETMITLLVTTLEHVRMDEDMFEDCCEILASVMERRVVRSAIEVVNADALFLMDLEAGRVEKRPTPVMKGFMFGSLKAV